MKHENTLSENEEGISNGRLATFPYQMMEMFGQQ